MFTIMAIYIKQLTRYGFGKRSKCINTFRVFCKQHFGKLNKFMCNHKLCEQCFKTRKRTGKVVECPVTNCKIISDTKLISEKDFTNFTDTLVSMKETSVLRSVQKYQTVIDEQEVNIEKQIHDINQQLDETSESVDKSKIELDRLYDKRQKELKDHFETLKDYMIEMGMKRKEQLDEMLGLVKEMKDLLQNQRKWFGDIVKKNAKTFDLSTLQSDIEDKMSSIEIVDMIFPPMDITIEPSDEWIAKDDLTISAPCPTMQRKILTTQSAAEYGLLELSSKTLVKNKTIYLPAEPKSLCVLNNNVYCACRSVGIVITDTTLTDKRCIKSGDMGYVSGVAPLPDSTLVVAADNGLFHITNEGEQLKQVEKGTHKRVRSRGAIVCAMSGSGNDVPHTITLYTYREKQLNRTKSFKLQFTSFSDCHITISLGHDVIYVSYFVDCCIYVLSLDGTVLTKHGREGRGGAGELHGPRAAATDAQDNLLVCDYFSQRLQVMSHRGDWRLLQSDEKIVRPRDAVMVDGKVFVVRGNYPKCYLCVFDVPNKQKPCTIS